MTGWFMPSNCNFFLENEFQFTPKLAQQGLPAVMSLLPHPLAPSDFHRLKKTQFFCKRSNKQFLLNINFSWCIFPPEGQRCVTKKGGKGECCGNL